MIGDGSRARGEGPVRLREITPEDAPLLFALRMDPRSRPMFRSVGEVPYAVHERLVADYFDERNRDHWFVIEERGEAVGTIALYGRSADGREAEWGRFVVRPERRGQGVGAAALALLLDHAREAGVERLRCEVLAENRSALGLYLRLGFGEERREEEAGRTFAHLLLRFGGPP